MQIIDEVKRHRHEIKTDSYSASWSEVINWYRDGELKIDPDYQRLFRWSILQQTRLIESILLDVPLPPIFLAENEDGKNEVIDGLQRISTILKFFSDEIFKTESIRSLVKAIPIDSPDNDLKLPSKLSEGPLLKDLKDHTAQTLPSVLLQNLRKARVDLIILKSTSSKKARYEVFKRVNTYGSQLSPQEIRSCAARVLDSNFPTRLSEISLNTHVISALGLSSIKVKKKYVEEMVLRLLAFCHSNKLPTHDIEGFLDQFIEFAADGGFAFTPLVESRLRQTFELIESVYPNGRAFKRLSKGRFVGGFMPALFDMVAVGVYHNIDRLNAAKFKQKHMELLKAEEISDLLGSGSNTRKKIEGRVSLGKDWFGQ